jgi:hypothetical protein
MGEGGKGTHRGAGASTAWMGEPFSDSSMWYTISLRRAWRGLRPSSCAGVFGRKVENEAAPGVRAPSGSTGAALFNEVMQGARAGSSAAAAAALALLPPPPPPPGVRAPPPPPPPSAPPACAAAPNAPTPFAAVRASFPARRSFSSSSCTSPPHSRRKSPIFIDFTREGKRMRKKPTSFRISSKQGSTCACGLSG